MVRLYGGLKFALLLSASLVPFAAAAAQSPEPGAAPPPDAKQAGQKRVYTPADFVRFAPKTAFDMLRQVPGFSIRSADSERGLGQASENVLINGQRIANKSGGAIDQLQRVSASNVDRIEIVDAASLGIAGLTGQVANVILVENKKGSGQFEWDPSFRAHYARPQYFAGSISYSGKQGPVDYTLSAKNDSGRGGLGGPIWIYDGDGVLTETRTQVYHSEYDQANLQLKLGIDGPGSSVGNLTLAYTPYWSPQFIGQHRTLVTGEERTRTTITRLDGYQGDINGDYEFAAGPGRLKLIGLRHWEHEPLVTTQILTFDTTGADPVGTRFSRDTHLGETILRGEYSWKSGPNDWQASFERAYNSLDQVGRLYQLNDDGDFEEVPFPDGTGQVTEVRYEGIGTLSRPLASNLDLQIAGGAEISTLDRLDDDQAARHFVRPKGSVTLGWRPSKGLDVSLKLRRRVGQISFYNFLAQPKLSQDRENAGNPELVPPQSWEIETEFARDLGRWGKTSLNLHYYRVHDIIDVIPIGEDGEGIGNLPRADRAGFASTSTFQLEPLGIEGGKIDMDFGGEWTSVKDPLTGERRPISGIQDKWFNVSFRHDIPGTQIAYSVYFNYGNYTRNYYLTEVYRELDLPTLAGFYIEDKNVFGTTVRAQILNVFNGRHTLWRTVYDGYRDRNPVAFVEHDDQLIGPLFLFSIKGSF